MPGSIVDVASGALQTIFRTITLRSYRGLDLLVVFLGPLELFLSTLSRMPPDAVLLEETLNSFRARPGRSTLTTMAVTASRPSTIHVHQLPPWQSMRYRVGQKVCQQDGAGPRAFSARKSACSKMARRLALDGITMESWGMKTTIQIQKRCG